MLKSCVYIHLSIFITLSAFGMHTLHKQGFRNHISHHENVYSNYSAQEAENDSQQENEEKAKEEEERKKLEELRSRLEEALQQERLQQQDSEEEKIEIEIHSGLAFLHIKEEKRATAIFQIPDQSKIHDLTDQQKERARELFKVYSVENQGQYKVVKFQYKDASLLPQNREQAIYLLYSPYIKNKFAQSSTALSPLNELQKEAFEKQKEKNAITKREIKVIALYELKKRVEDHLKRQEGLFGTTKVKTQTGHCAIEELRVGDLVACYDFKNKKEIYNPITYADRLHLTNHIQIIINDEVLQVAPEHKFYIHSTNSWVKAKDLIENSDLRLLLDPGIQDVKQVAEELDVIRISVNNQQNYYITNNNLLVHNFLFLDVSILWGIGEGIEITWAALGPTVTAAATGLIYWIASKFCHVDKIHHANKAAYAEIRHEVWTKKDDIYFKAENNIQKPQPSPKNNSGGPGQPNKDPEKDNDRKQHQHITNKEADQAAKELGFKKTNLYTKTGNRPIYKKGNKYISADRNGHNGGFWKMANSAENLDKRTTRIGTYNRSLDFRIGD